MSIVEVGIKLDKPLEYYIKMLEEQGLKKVYEVTTHDIYYTDKDLNGFTEREMKNACIRLRSCNDSNYVIQNDLSDLNIKEVSKEELSFFEEKLSKLDYKKVFDTVKKDYHYIKDGMNSKIQLQEIDDIGLVVYYDNKAYYGYDENIQRQKLIEELNTYGFNVNNDSLDIDKLRTLYYGKETYSLNQNL